MQGVATPASTQRPRPALDTRAAAKRYATATAIIQALRRLYEVRPQAEGLDSVRWLEAAELNETAAHWAALEHRRTELGMTQALAARAPGPADLPAGQHRAGDFSP